MANLAELRKDLAEARIRLRHLEVREKWLRAAIERDFIDLQPGTTLAEKERALGANAEARERALILSLALDDGWSKLQDDLLHTRDEVEGIEAAVESALDIVREQRRQTSEKLADALLALASRARPFAPDLDELLEEAKSYAR